MSDLVYENDIAEKKAGLYAQAEAIQAKINAGAYAANEANCCTANQCDTKPMRESLRDRIATRRYRAEKETRKAMALAELQHLLDKHPEVARIFELMEEVGQ